MNFTHDDFVVSFGIVLIVITYVKGVIHGWFFRRLWLNRARINDSDDR